MKNLKEVLKTQKMITKAMGLKGEIKPGDMTMKAREIFSPSRSTSTMKKKVLPRPHTKKGLAIRGLI